MYAQLNWAYEARGTSGFIEYASNPKKPASIEAVNASSNAIPKTPSTAHMTPRMSPGEGLGASSNKRASTQVRNPHDVGASADLRSPWQARNPRESGRNTLSPLQARSLGKIRSMSTENATRPSGLGRPDRGSDKDDCEEHPGRYTVPSSNMQTVPFDAYRRVRAFEERVSGLDQQINIIQKVINETLTRNKSLEQELQVISDKGRAKTADVCSLCLLNGAPKLIRYR